MPDRMRRYLTGNTCFDGILFHQSLDRPRGQSWQIHRILLALRSFSEGGAVTDEQSLTHITAFFQILADCLLRGGGEKDNTHFVSLAPHGEFVTREVEVGIEAAQLGYAKPRRKKQLEYRSIAQCYEVALALRSFSEGGGRHETVEFVVRDQV